jgi:anti-anti-sigma factor
MSAADDDPPATFDESVASDGSIDMRVTGELDMLSGAQLGELLAGHNAGGRSVRLDLSAISFIDSSGLGHIVESRANADRDGNDLSVGPVSESVTKIMQLTDSEYLHTP